MSIFQAGERFPGADKGITRGLALLKMEKPAIKRVVEAAKATKLPIKAPFWVSNAWAHVAFPTKKVCIMLRNGTDRRRFNEFTERWKAHGWTMLGVAEYNIEKVNDEQLVVHLKDALKDLKGVKR